VSLPANGSTELVVVDNGSTDETATVVRSFSRPGLLVRYVLEARRGKGHAYNAGIAAARGRVLLFTDDDMRFPHEWIEGMCGPIFAGEVDAVAGGVRIADHLERPWMHEMHRLFIGGQTDTLTQENFDLQGTSMAVGRNVIEKVPAFDDELGPGSPTGLWSGEETLFSWQVVKAGFRVKLCKDVCVEHHFDPRRLGRQTFLSRAIYTGRSRAYLSYHWDHADIKWPFLRYLKAWVRLRMYQWSEKLHFKTASEGLPLTEYDRVSGFHFYRQYLRERARPRKYERHGLVKLQP
jgi:glycosyltransferase involved in cell wall biosynthesis